MIEEAELAKLAAEFRREGFVHVPGLFSADELAGFGEAVDEAVRMRKRLDTRRLEEKTPYEQSFVQCQYVWEDFPKIRPLTFHSRVGRIVAALLGAKKVRLWHDQALYKEAGGRETEAHTDQPYWPIAETDTATIWIPFDGVDQTSGCMGYVPGSHRTRAEFVDIFKTPGAGEALKARFADTPAVFVPCAAGDAIFHHGSTVHMAGPNRSGHTRRVYTAIYFRDGCTRGGDRYHPSVDRDGIEIGQRIGGAATPIVWPREDGSLPEPEPWPDEFGVDWVGRAKRLGIIPQRPN